MMDGENVGRLRAVYALLFGAASATGIVADMLPALELASDALRDLDGLGNQTLADVVKANQRRCQRRVRLWREWTALPGHTPHALTLIGNEIAVLEALSLADGSAEGEAKALERVGLSTSDVDEVIGSADADRGQMLLAAVNKAREAAGWEVVR